MVITNLDDVYKELQQKNVKISDKYQYSNKYKTNNKVKNMSLGRIWFNLLLPDDFRLIDEPVNSSLLEQIFREIYEKYESEEIFKYFNIVQKEAFKLTSIVPVSFRIEDLYLPKFIIDKRQKELYDVDLSPQDYEQKRLEIAKEFMDWLKKNNSPIYNIITSGARSNVGDIANLFISRGSVVDIENNTSKPIKSSLNDGLTGTEYYTNAKEARNVLFLRAKGSAEPGYLSKKISFANSNIQIGSNDCKTKKYLEIKINKTLQNNLQGRFYLDNDGKLKEINADTPDLTDKIIKLRSPLYCKEKDNICKTCYGKLFEKFKSKYIGILVGNIMAEVGVEGYSMKARHMSSQVNFKPTNFTKDITVVNGDISKLFQITENDIIANYDCYININLKEYSDEDIVETGEYYVIPGMISIFNKQTNEPSEFFVNYDVKINKTDNMTEDRNVVTINYKPGDVVIHQTYVNTNTNVKIITQLFEGRCKFIKDPAILLINLANQMPKIDLVHLELIVSNMFRCKDNLDVPCRLTGKYDNSEILGQWEQPFNDSWLLSLAFERIDKAIHTGLVDNKDAIMTPIEKIVNADYDL